MLMLNMLYSYYSKHDSNIISQIAVKFLVKGMKMKISWLKLCGMKIGNGTKIKTGIDAFPEPYMVEIGEKAYIASGVTFMTHDGALSWMSRAMGYTEKRTDKIGSIVVKNNCFIGANSIILQNVTVGSNSIVGMGSIVTKDVPDNSVVAGIPAKRICSVDEYLCKYKDCVDYTCGWTYEKKRAYYEAKRQPLDIKQ